LWLEKSTTTSLSDKKIVMHYLYALLLKLIKIAECSIYLSSHNLLQVEIKSLMRWRSKNSLYQAECWSNYFSQAIDKAESYQCISESLEREADEHEE